MRLIDADALTQDLAKGFSGSCGGEATLEQIVSDDTLADAIKTVEEQPTVDATPVIRCKDCKYWDGHWAGLNVTMCRAFDWKAKAEDFCSFAERKEK